MSSLTIMTIAVDRYRIIVHSHLRQVGPCGAWLLLPFIFLTSCVLSVYHLCQDWAPLIGCHAGKISCVMRCTYCGNLSLCERIYSCVQQPESFAFLTFKTNSLYLGNCKPILIITSRGWAVPSSGSTWLSFVKLQIYHFPQFASSSIKAFFVVGPSGLRALSQN